VKKKWRIVTAVGAVCVVLALAGAAYADRQIHEKHPLVQAPSGEIVHLQNRANFVATYARAEKDGPMEVPAYKSADLLKNNNMSFFLGRDSGFYKSMNSRLDLFDGIETLFPSTALRKATDGDHVYVMYDTEKGERLFLFFSKAKNDYLTVDGFPILMAKKLSHDDFGRLKMGDSIDSVAAIDPVVVEYQALFDTGDDKAVEAYAKLGAPPTSVHLLSDGVLKIVYSRKPSGGYVISDMVYREDFVLQGLDGATCYKIADADFVK